MVMLLSRVFLHTSYKLAHYLGVGVALSGLGGLILADVITGKNRDDSSGDDNLLKNIIIFTKQYIT